MTCTVHDVAAYILETHGPVTAVKLQKLVYYSQAWSLVWDERALFPERIEAWVGGPVVPALYEQHRGQFEVTSLPLGDAAKLDENARATVDEVLRAYGDKTGQWLSDLTHAERPWLDARVGLAPLERGTREIGLASMSEYYSGLAPTAADA